MGSRLDTDRQERLEPQRMKFAKQKIEELGYEVVEVGDNRLEFEHEGSTIQFYPYSGWATGKTINDGRGINNLLKQLKS